MDRSTYACVLIALIMGLVLCAVGRSRAEDPNDFYVGLFGGYSFPQGATNVEGHGSLEAVSFSDVALKNGWSGGLKLGWLLPPATYERWVNWEFEYWYQNLHIKPQTITATVSRLGSGQAALSGAGMNVHTFSSNFIVRRPTGILQPYIGVGPSLVYIDINAVPGTSTSLNVGNQSATALGLNILGGTRIMFGQNVGIFVEYKYNRAFYLLFNEISMDLNSHALVGGLVWNFDSFTMP